MNRSSRLVLCACLAALAPALAKTPAEGYRFHGVPWPGGVVPYVNGAPDQAFAVSRAVRAWNESGAHVRFVAVSPERAKLVIAEDAKKVYCGESHASVGYVPDARVVIFPARGITHACNPYWAMRVLTHEAVSDLAFHASS